MDDNANDRRAVIVVGAGASRECGFLLGRELLGRSRDKLRSICTCLEASDSEIEEAERDRKRFVQTCRDTSYGTIDSLLLQRADLRESGALTAVAALIDAQIKVIRHGTQTSWYSKLYQWLFCEPGWWRTTVRDSTPNLSIVSFNYDINAALAIARGLVADTGRDAAAIWDEMDTLPIRHVYGQLDLDDLVVSMLEDHDHLPRVTLETLRHAGKRLVLSTDEAHRHGAESIAECRRSIWNASDVLFFGFGFDPANLDRIGIGSDHGKWRQCARRVTAIVRHMDSSQLERIRSVCPNVLFTQSDISSEAIVRWFLNRPSTLKEELSRFSQVGSSWAFPSA